MSHVKWLLYEGVDIFRIKDDAYSYIPNHVALDADGCPRAYHPDDIGLDFNQNAGYPNKGWLSVLVEDPNQPGKPYVQTSGETKGFFVSKTSLMDPSSQRPVTDPAKYVDSERFPYIVFPGGFFAIKGTGSWGDVVMCRTLTGDTHQSSAIVADGGPTKAPLGEISLKLAAALGGHNPNPRNGSGAPRGPIQYVVFPGSRVHPVWPRTAADIHQQATDLLKSIGGWPEI